MSDKKNVIRYSRDVMLNLHDSPLVQIPDSMPSLLSWFGEDPDGSNKNILNSAVVNRSVNDKSIVLGPTKTNFASSLYGGLKKSEDNKSRRQMEDSRSTGIKEYRAPRPYMGDKGFPTNNKSDRKYSNNSPPSNNKRYNNNNEKGRRDHNNNRHRNTQYQEYEQERLPEWMDYSPDVEVKEESTFTNDLEAWKSTMKKKDGVEVKEKKVEDIFSSLTITQEHHEEDRHPQKSGSRFAKFFAKREDTGHPRSISLNDLFQTTQQSKEDTPTRVYSEDDILKSLGAKKEDNPEEAMGFNRVLQILSQPKPSYHNNNTQHSPLNQLNSLHPVNKNPIMNTMDTHTMNTMDTHTMNTMDTHTMNTHNAHTLNTHNAHTLNTHNTHTLNTHNAHTLNTHNTHTMNTHNTLTMNQLNTQQLQNMTLDMDNEDKKMINNRFGNNLPTSVLRQMSARNERSPSLQSKSTPPMRYSPSKYPPPPPQPQPPQQQYPFMYRQYPNPPLMDPPFEMMQYNEYMPPMHFPPQPRPMMPPHPIPVHLQYPLQREYHPNMPHAMSNGVPPQIYKNQGWERQ